MAAQHRQQPSRLFIPPMLNSQLANSVDSRPMFSPALQTSHHPGFHPLPSAHPFNSGFPLQTPVQPSFFHGPHPPSGPPPRQMGHGHRPNGSIAHIPSVGMQQSIPMTPFGSHFPPHMMHSGPPNASAQPFVPKSRRTPSMIGGPPKATLGGPNKKSSPLPPSSQVAAIAEKVKTKKIPVKIPIESERDGEAPEGPKSLWSRRPIPTSELPNFPDPEPPEASSGEPYPDDESRRHLPSTVDVFLPTKEAWKEMKQRKIDEKLEKLGIERRSEFEHPDSLSMRARSASISSPADPALLMFKLNKLQKQQSAGNSASTSPQPHSAVSASPNHLRPQTHGHSMSLAQHPNLPQSAPNGFSLAYAGMKPDSPLLGNQSSQPASPLNIYAPQGRVPAQLFAPSAPSRTESRPDFARGFGLDIPEEEEEELEHQDSETQYAADRTADRTITDPPNIHEDNALLIDPVKVDNVDENVAAPKEGTHTRHASRISVALSIGSTTKNLDDAIVGHTRQSSMVVPVTGIEQKSESTVDALNEWTGSETDGLSDDQESIGEWSNPSDEERARQERLQRRYMRRMRREAQEAPRRLPEFPKPPEISYIARNDDEDIISNPSDEGRHMGYDSQVMNGLYYPQAQMDQGVRASRPLPPVPHSRDPSNQYSYYGSLPSQSPDHLTGRQLNVSISRPESTRHAKTPSLSGTKKELNPFAKPFVFAPRSGVTPSPGPAASQNEASTFSVQGSTPGHSRTSSGARKKLNAAAQEFKPGAFTFRLPDGVPKLAFPDATQEASRPLPEPPVSGITTAVQGREKRRRTSLSDGSASGGSELDTVNDSMASFRFPRALEPATVFARSAPTSPANRSEATANTSTKPGTLSGFSTLPPSLPPILGHEQRSFLDGMSESNFPSLNATRGSGLGDEQKSPQMTLPNLAKQKRAPIPLDFKHPVSTNMVPAGLFKNLGTGDPESARNSRGHNGSGLDFSESKSEISLDDLPMPRISRRGPRRAPKPEDLDDTEDEFDGATDASDDGVSEDAESTRNTQPISQCSRGPPDVTSYSQGLRLEDRLESLIDHKIDRLRNDLVNQLRGSGFISSSTDELVREAMAMFRTQLCDSATKGLTDNSMDDAHGDLDFEVIKGIVEQGQEELRKNIQEDLATILRNIRDTEGSVAPESLLELIRNVQELRTNVLATSARVSERLDAMEHVPQYKSEHPDREGLVIDIISALTPHLAAIRSEPIDYEGLTMQLSQAVKPHISQLIDLASDKRETADLIVEQLMPVLESFASSPSQFDTSNLVTEISATVNRIIAPIDTYSIKEEVADLVVERLDSRLATRDNDVSSNFDSLKNKITESVSPLLGKINGIGSSIKAISSEQGALASLTLDMSSKQADALSDLSTSVKKLSGLAEALQGVQSLIIRQTETSDAHAAQLDRIVSSIGSPSASGPGLSAEEKEAILSSNREVLARFTPIADTIISGLASYEAKQAELFSRLQAMDDSAQEVRRLNAQNADLQAQLNKARSQHGQIRVQHDDIAGRITSVEEERDQLREKVEKLNAEALAHVAEFAALQARNSEQEQAMLAALDRLKISDVQAQTFQERIAELEKTNRETTQENQQLKLKINRLEMESQFTTHDKESSERALKLLQEDRDRLAAQQSHWEEFHQTAEQIEKLANLMNQAESDEKAELQRIRDESKILEGEHAALKKRFKEQEGKIANIERASATARQNLAQAQQRSAEWERKAREFEGEVERLTTALDQSEQTKNQLDADCSLAKLQLEEKEAEDRIAKDRERKLEEQIAALKTQISNLTSELEEERKSKRTNAVGRGSRGRQSSSEYEPSEPPTPRINGKSLPNSNSARSSVVVSPQPARTTSTWDSMHAPRVRPTAAAYLSRSQRSSVYGSRAPSPTPSTVSVVTQGEDGWYS